MKQLFMVRRIVGASMLPYFQPGRIVLGWRAKRIRSGDVVIVMHDGLEKIKRVDRVRGDKLYVLGDNADASTDSRQFGWLPMASVKARVVWPHS